MKYELLSQVIGYKLMNPIGLYIHIPFCLKKCFYCDFNSIPIGRAEEDILAAKKKAEKVIDRYTEALCSEINAYQSIPHKKVYSVESVFLGGGTPSLISADNFVELLNICRTVFRVSDGAEITIEANPGTVSIDSLKGYLKAGINRLSLGCQSFNNEELKRIGRVHKAEDIYRVFEFANEAGFKNINIDLIFGIPGQISENFKSSLEKAISLSPQHISLYNLTIEENTPFYNLNNKREMDLPCDDEQIEMYEYSIRTLKANGFGHYEISNFAQQGKKCLHNENYWRHGEYLGFGAGAHSFQIVQGSEVAAGFSLRNEVQSPERRGESLTRPIRSSLKGIRWWNLKNVEDYCHAIEKGISPSESKEELDENKLLSEAIMLGLRMTEGIETDIFYNKYGVLIEERYKNEIEFLKNEGLLELENNRLRLTYKGILFSNEVFIRFMSCS